MKNNNINNIIKIFAILFIITFVLDLNGVVPSSFISVIVFITLLLFPKFINIKKGYNPKSKESFLNLKNKINSQIRLLRQNKIKKKSPSSLKLNKLLIHCDSFQKLSDSVSQFELVSKNLEINQRLINLMQIQDFYCLNNLKFKTKQVTENGNDFDFNYLKGETSVWQN